MGTGHVACCWTSLTVPLPVITPPSLQSASLHVRRAGEHHVFGGEVSNGRSVPVTLARVVNGRLWVCWMVARTCTAATSWMSRSGARAASSQLGKPPMGKRELQEVPARRDALRLSGQLEVLVLVGHAAPRAVGTRPGKVLTRLPSVLVRSLDVLTPLSATAAAPMIRSGSPAPRPPLLSCGAA